MNDKPTDLMGANELRQHLKGEMEELVGTCDLGEGNRRLSVVQERRYADE